MARSWGVSAVVLLLLGALLGLFAWKEHEQVVSAEQNRLNAVAEVLEANIGDELKAVSVMLDMMRADIPAALSMADGVTMLNRRLSMVSEAVPIVYKMLYVDADGNVAASTIPELMGQNFRGSEHYEKIKAGLDPKLIYLSPPYVTPMGNYSVGVSKVLLDRDGAFNGYLLATLNADFFMNRMQSVTYAPDMRISVAHSDGKVVYSTQQDPDLRGVDLSLNPESPFSLHIKRGDRASFMTDYGAASDVGRRYIAARSVSLPPGLSDKFLLLAASRDMNAVLAEWRRGTLEKGLFFAVILLGTLLTQWMLFRRSRALAALNAEKHAEEVRAQQALDESNERFRGYFQNMAVGAVQLGRDGHFELVNERYCEMTGFERSELIEKMKPADLTHPDDRLVEQKAFADFWQNPDIELDLEKRLITKDGKTIWVHVSAHAVRDASGSVKFTTGVVQDITARKQLISDLEAAKIAAESANRAKTLFLGNMSHEMRTPLHQISGIATLLRRETLTDKQSQRLAQLEASAKRMEAVVGGILTLVSLESGTTDFKAQPVSVSEIANEVIQMFQERAAAKQIKFDRDFSPLPDHLMGDAAHLNTILSSYISNAITFSDRGTITVIISCEREESGSALVRIAVRDEGRGIAAEDLPRLFSNFEQADNSLTRQFGGTGVGLSIAKKLARLMGGDAGCESEPGRGSTFWVTILMPRQILNNALSEASGGLDFQI